MSLRPIHLPDPERIALAVDALCVGSSVPVLIHAEDDPSFGSECPFGLFCTPLAMLKDLDETIAIIGALSPPEHWRLAGLCAPTTIRVSEDATVVPHRFKSWIIHVVAESGGSASRLAVPDAIELSGPLSVIDHGHALHQCLARLVRGDQRTPHDSAWVDHVTNGFDHSMQDRHR